MYQRYTKGSDAYYAAEQFEEPLRSLEDAAENACTVIEQLTEDLDEKSEEIDGLEKQVEALEEQLLKAPNHDLEFLRVLRNINVYVCDNIRTLEARCGSEVKEEEAPKHGGEQPPTR